MLLRVAAFACACVLSLASAVAEELGPEQARAFVVGKLFSYTCFDGTAGMGRIFADGSVVGTIRPGGHGEVRFATLPAGTIKVDSTSVCAHVSGLPLEPCFRLEKIDHRSFRGSVAGLGFAYCDFAQHNPRTQIMTRSAEAGPLNLGGFPEAPQARAVPLTPVHAAPLTPVHAVPLEDLRPAIHD
jgi:hypothetical protein